MLRRKIGERLPFQWPISHATTRSAGVAPKMTTWPGRRSFASNASNSIDQALGKKHLIPGDRVSSARPRRGVDPTA